MGYNSNDVYYQPEAFGLTTIGEIEWSEPNYDFHFSVVWKKGRSYYFGTDSGCSCPSPFENFTSVEDLEGPLTKPELRKRILEMVDEQAVDVRGYYGYTKEQLMEQVTKLFMKL